jgi:hypothetical protein
MIHFELGISSGFINWEKKKCYKSQASHGLTQWLISVNYLVIYSKMRRYDELAFSPLKLHRMYLKQFWDRFNPETRYVQSTHSKQEVINALIEYGSIVLRYKSKTHTRASWDRRKNRLKKFKRFTCCYACGRYAQARHHIIWLSHGGRNQTNNVIALCSDCHAEIHPWLKSVV